MVRRPAVAYDGVRAVKCVKCPGELALVRVDDVDVDQCVDCGGIWFDALELERVLASPSSARALVAPPRRPADDDVRGRCPRCRGDGALVRVASRGAPIHVDTCAVCGGKWLDGGELALLRKRGLVGAMRRVLDWVLDVDLP